MNNIIEVENKSSPIITNENRSELDVKVELRDRIWDVLKKWHTLALNTSYEKCHRLLEKDIRDLRMNEDLLESIDETQTLVNDYKKICAAIQSKKRDMAISLIGKSQIALVEKISVLENNLDVLNEEQRNVEFRRYNKLRSKLIRKTGHLMVLEQEMRRCDTNDRVSYCILKAARNEYRANIGCLDSEIKASINGWNYWQIKVKESIEKKQFILTRIGKLGIQIKNLADLACKVNSNIAEAENSVRSSLDFFQNQLIALLHARNELLPSPAVIQRQKQVAPLRLQMALHILHSPEAVQLSPAFMQEKVYSFKLKRRVRREEAPDELFDRKWEALNHPHKVIKNFDKNEMSDWLEWMEPRTCKIEAAFEYYIQQAALLES